MPPILTDDEAESDGPDEIPAKGGKLPTRTPAKIPEGDVVDDADEDDDEDEDGEEYKVEGIEGHRFVDDGVVEYRIKWLGYPKKADQTWEPIGNLENAMDIVNEYHDKIGGAPIQAQSAAKKKGAKRSASSANLDSPAVKTSAKKRGRVSETNGTNTKANLPESNWDSHILRVHTVIEDNQKDAKGKDTRVLSALVEWHDNSIPTTQHPLDVLRRKAPQRMLDYFVQHLVFRPTSAKDDAEAEAALKAEEV